MAAKSERVEAVERIGTYHEEQLGLLLDRAGEAIRGFQAGELDAFDVDAELFQYGRAAKKLWTFCNAGEVISTAALIAEGAAIDWWERGAFRRR
jgi:hypothetical protein